MGRPKKQLSEYSKSELEEKVWEECSIYVRMRDARLTTGTELYASCVTCGKTNLWKAMDAGHWITRGHKATKFDVRNIHAQCKGCNKYKSGLPHIHERRIIEMYGIEVRDELLALSGQIRNFTKEELLELYELFKRKQKEI